MITREGFYAAFESLKRHVELLRSVEDFLHTDLGSSPVGEMVDEAMDYLLHLYPSIAKFQLQRWLVGQSARE